MKAVIFDMDGVLINTEPLHYECWREVLREEGIEMDFDTYKPCIGSTREYLLELIWDNYIISATYSLNCLRHIFYERKSVFLSGASGKRRKGF